MITSNGRNARFCSVSSLYWYAYRRSYALTWKDIDFKNNTINIDKTMERIKVDSKYQWLIDTPKRPKSIRVIPLANRAKEQLLWLKTVSPGLKASGDDHIFVILKIIFHHHSQLLLGRLKRSSRELILNLTVSAYMISDIHLDLCC